MVGRRSLEPAIMVRIHVPKPFKIKFIFMGKKVVAVGMSGGVDSTMAAYLLKKQGYKVIGLTMSVYDKTVGLPDDEKSGCYGPGEEKNLKEAEKACKKIGIKHYIIDLKEQFKDNVINYFCNSYMDGNTPNPCVMCNTKIKFGALIEEAKKSGLKFDYFATGHYVRVGEENGRFFLKKGLDPKKDQSYFLYKLNQEQLSRLIFPIGEYVKKDLKYIAIECGLEEYAIKKESQDFIKADNYSVIFNKENIIPGNIINVKGEVVGKHNGIVNYTIGQRKGLDLGGSDKVLYVINIDVDSNTIIVGPKEYLYCNGLIAKNMNWMYVDKIDKEVDNLECKVRLSSETIKCSVVPLNKNEVKILFKEPQISVKPGQSVVIYDNDIVLGGGVIASKIN